MRVPIIAGNWKMNNTVEDAVALVASMIEELDRFQGVEVVLCPPFVSLWPVREQIKSTSLKLGAQNMCYAEKGAYTGEISPLMLAPLCRYVILGHSERRQYFGETDDGVNKKVQAALRAGLDPIVCVGERLEENEAGRTEEVVVRQVRGAFAQVDIPPRVVVAYEPIWAIGTGRAATGPQANATIGLIRQVVGDLAGKGVSQSLRILYGGSVTGDNIVEFASQPEIDGALVGGASLKPEFIRIVEQTAKIQSSR
ncbi:MAG: triose-phosphate isomerase [Chloroflexi bacterium]|nr:triose-phosphate isomerase [Chloroflexota bacterium]